MKKLLFILLSVSMSYGLMAQDTLKQKEIGLVFSNLNNFGLTYKTGTNKSLWRFTTFYIKGGNMDDPQDNTLYNDSNTGFGVRVGKEYRKNIAHHLEMRYGADLSFKYTQSIHGVKDISTHNRDIYHKRTTYQPGINLVFGFNYIIKENIVIGAELLPGFSYTTGTSVAKDPWTNNGEEVKHNISGYSYGLSNTSVLLSLSYRFRN